MVYNLITGFEVEKFDNEKGYIKQPMSINNRVKLNGNNLPLVDTQNTLS